MALCKQAKVLTKKELPQILDLVKNGRYAKRDRVMVLLSFKAGLRAKEISLLRWSMITDASGQISDYIYLTDEATKGRAGRVLPLNKELQQALIDLFEESKPDTDSYVIKSARGSHLTRVSICHWFRIVYKTLRLHGCSGHSGRRTFGTNAARLINQVGGSLKDVQILLGHKSIQTTQRYIDEDIEAKNKVIQLI